MTKAFAKATILVTALCWTGFAFWLGVAPASLLHAFGIEQSTPSMLTEIRAFYGGIELAIAAAMLILLRRGDLFASLLIGGLPLAGSAALRIVGQFLDGYSTTHLAFAAFECMGALFCFAGIRSLSVKQTM